jgi:hypothetical protein
MKNLHRALLIVPCGMAFAASAQIAIGLADMPTAGDTVRYRNTTTMADMENTGPGVTWDFSELQPGAEGADTIVSVESTPFLYQFFFNNGLLYPDNNADYAMRGADMGFQVVTINQVYNYYKSNSSGLRDVGFGANINGIPTSVQRTPVDWIYHFPLEFGNLDSSASHFQISVPTLGFYGQDQMRSNEVDGWGTLILPTDTFDVLRVKSRIQRNDTIYIDQFNTGFAVPEPETIEYKWLAQGMDEPVLQVTTVAGVNTVARFYYDPEGATTAVPELPTVGNGLQAWPNPASGLLQVHCDQPGTLHLIAADGRVVRTMQNQGLGVLRIGLDGLPDGLYTLRAVDGAAALRVVVTH